MRFLVDAQLPRADAVQIEGIDRLYKGCDGMVAEAIDDWLGRLP